MLNNWFGIARALSQPFARISYGQGGSSKYRILFFLKSMKDLPVIVNDVLSSDDIKSIKRIDVVNESFDGIVGAINFIPVVGGGIAAGIAQFRNSRASFLEIDFYRKFLALIYGVQDLSPKNIRTFLDELASNANDYAGNVITNMINRIDNTNKAIVLSNLVRARIENRISINDFFRLSSMLERIPYIDLNELRNYENPFYDETGDTELLYATGALKLASLNANDGDKFSLSYLGALLLEVGMNAGPVKRLTGGTEIPQLEWEKLGEPDIEQMNDDSAMFEFDRMRGK